MFDSILGYFNRSDLFSYIFLFSSSVCIVDIFVAARFAVAPEASSMEKRWKSTLK